MTKVLTWTFIAILIVSIWDNVRYIIRYIYSDRNRDDCLELKFNQFKKFYSINP